VRAVIQVLSRLWALWGLVAVAPEACSTGAVTLLSAGPAKLQLNYVSLMLCWSVSEILRYGFYACKVRHKALHGSRFERVQNTVGARSDWAGMHGWLGRGLARLPVSA
jgi:hypothetical protein